MAQEASLHAGPSAADQITRALFASVFDRPTIAFKPADEIGIEPVARACRWPHSGPHSLARALNRNAFLYGCLDFTDEAPVEHLIVGFGRRKGSTIRVRTICHWIGDSHSVPMPLKLRGEIVDYVGRSPANQVLVFHNHPHTIFDAVLNPPPIASVDDRGVMLSLLRHPVVALKSLLQGRQVQWHVGQNGYVREFSTPDVIGLLRK